MQLIAKRASRHSIPLHSNHRNSARFDSINSPALMIISIAGLACFPSVFDAAGAGNARDRTRRRIKGHKCAMTQCSAELECRNATPGIARVHRIPSLCFVSGDSNMRTKAAVTSLRTKCQTTRRCPRDAVVLLTSMTQCAQIHADVSPFCVLRNRKYYRNARNRDASQLAGVSRGNARHGAENSPSVNCSLKLARLPRRAVSLSSIGVV